MKVRRFRRQYRGLWRQLSRLAVVIACFELLAFVMLAHRAEAEVAPAVDAVRPADAARAVDAQAGPAGAHAEKLAS